MDLGSVDTSHHSINSNLTEHNIDQEQNEVDTNTVEAWRKHFEDKRREREEKQQYPKAPLWIFEPEKPKVQLKVPNEVEKVRDTFFKAQSLFWDEIRENIYFIDEVNKAVVRYTPAQNELKVATMEANGNPSFVIPINDNSYEYVVGIGPHLYKMEWNGKSKKVSYLQLLKEQSIMDDIISYGKADPIGRLVIGSSHADQMENIKTKSEVESEVITYPIRTYIRVYEAPNKFTSTTELQMDKCTGLAWNWNTSKIYIINSGQNEILVYGYDIQEGKLKDKVDGILWKKLSRVKGLPQCITCDSFDNLWVGCSKIAQIIEINSMTKRVMRIISLDRHCLDVTSIVFGHTNRDVLYVTTQNSQEQESPDLERDYARRNDNQGSPGLSSLIRVWNVDSRALADYRVRIF